MSPAELRALLEHELERLEDRRHRELADARRAVVQARGVLERREKQLAALEAYWKELA